MARAKSFGDPLAALLALSGAIAVIAGAYGAHGATGKAAEWLSTGAHYQMIHAAAGLVMIGKGTLKRLIDQIIEWLEEVIRQNHSHN